MRTLRSFGFLFILRVREQGGHLRPIPNTKKPFNKIILSIALATPPGMSMGEYKEAPFYLSKLNPSSAIYCIVRNVSVEKGGIKRLINGYRKGRYDE